MIFGIAAVLIFTHDFFRRCSSVSIFWAAPFLWHIWGLEVQERFATNAFYI